MKKQLVKFKTALADQAEFRSMYRFLFNIAKMGTQKFLGTSVALEYTTNNASHLLTC